TGAYSWPYLARWSGGDPSLVRASAERAIGCARAILDTSKTPALPGQQVGLGLCRAGEAERVRAPSIDAEDEARRARARRRRIYAERARQARRSERSWVLER
ncbi:MAG: hypothetical protein ACRD0J_00065, partial [Acidimicrobiales bacterium]